MNARRCPRCGVPWDAHTAEETARCVVTAGFGEATEPLALTDALLLDWSTTLLAVIADVDGPTKRRTLGRNPPW